jgi:hypothetical protein
MLAIPAKCGSKNMKSEAFLLIWKALDFVLIRVR